MKLNYDDVRKDPQNMIKALLSLMTVPTQQLFNFLLCKLTEKDLQTEELKIPIKEYMAVRGIKDEKEARKQIDNGLDVLYNFSLSFIEKGKKEQDRDFINVRILVSKSIENGYIIVRFSQSFIEIMEGRYEL